MEYVVVKFSEERDVYVDDQRNGKTNEMLRVSAGLHTFTLGDPQNYSPSQIDQNIVDTNVLEPAEIEFTV